MCLAKFETHETHETPTENDADTNDDTDAGARKI